MEIGGRCDWKDDRLILDLYRHVQMCTLTHREKNLSADVGGLEHKQCLLDKTGPLHSGTPNSCACQFKIKPVSITGL